MDLSPERPICVVGDALAVYVSENTHYPLKSVIGCTSCTVLMPLPPNVLRCLSDAGLELADDAKAAVAAAVSHRFLLRATLVRAEAGAPVGIKQCLDLLPALHAFQLRPTLLKPFARYALSCLGAGSQLTIARRCQRGKRSGCAQRVRGRKRLAFNPAAGALRSWVGGGA